jgi:hypothetical protein
MARLQARGNARQQARRGNREDAKEAGDLQGE